MRPGVLHANLGILLGFVPLIVYGLLAGTSVASVVFALGAAAAVTVLAGYADLRKGRILIWTTLVLFAGLFAAAGIAGMTGLVPWLDVIIYAALAAAAFGSIAAGLPFTLQYAREMTDRSVWDKPGFLRANLLMTGVWGGVFAFNLLISYLTAAVPGFPSPAAHLLTYAVLAAGIVFTIWYPRYVQRGCRPVIAGKSP